MLLHSSVLDMPFRGAIAGAYLTEESGFLTVEFSNDDIRIGDHPAHVSGFQTLHSIKRTTSNGTGIFMCATLRDFEPKYIDSGDAQSDRLRYEDSKQNYRIFHKYLRALRNFHVEKRGDILLEHVSFTTQLPFVYSIKTRNVKKVWQINTLTSHGKATALQNTTFLTEILQNRRTSQPKVEKSEDDKYQRRKSCDASRRGSRAQPRSQSSRDSDSKPPPRRRTTNGSSKRRDSTIVVIDPSQKYYNILGIGSDANDRQIKQAYQSLARIHHSDKVHQQMGESAESLEKRREAATEKMKELNNAYDHLRALKPANIS